MNPGRATGWVIALLAVALVGVTAPDPDADHRVSWTSTTLGAAAATERLRVQVDTVTTGTALATGYGDTLTARGTVVVVGLRAAALTGQLSFVVEARTRDGRWYAQRAENPARLGATPAGFTTVGSAVFVVPPDRVAGLRLAITPGGRQPVSHTRGVLVDLGLTGDEPDGGAVGPGEARTEVSR